MVDVNKLQMPVANQSAVDRASAVNQARMQSNLAMTSGQAMMSGPAAAQKAAGQMAKQQGQIAAQAKQAEIKQEVGLAQQELHNTAQRHDEQQIMHSENMAKRHESQRLKLSKLGRDVKQKLLDDNLEFDKTQRETRFRTERQLADFVTLKTQDEQALKAYAQSVEAAYKKDIIMMRAAYAALDREERHQFSLDERERNKQLEAEIKEYKARLEAEARRKRRGANGTARMIGAAKVAAGVYIATLPGGQTAGTSLAVSGAKDFAGAEGASDQETLSEKG